MEENAYRSMPSPGATDPADLQAHARARLGLSTGSVSLDEDGDVVVGAKSAGCSTERRGEDPAAMADNHSPVVANYNAQGCSS